LQIKRSVAFVVLRPEPDDDFSVMILACRVTIIGYLSESEGQTNKPMIFNCSPKGHQMKMVVPTVSFFKIFYHKCHFFLLTKQVETPNEYLTPHLQGALLINSNLVVILWEIELPNCRSLYLVNIIVLLVGPSESHKFPI
jgi:hypothetical protein